MQYLELISIDRLRTQVVGPWQYAIHSSCQSCCWSRQCVMHTTSHHLSVANVTPTLLQPRSVHRASLDISGTFTCMTEFETETTPDQSTVDHKAV